MRIMHETCVIICVMSIALVGCARGPGYRVHIPPPPSEAVLGQLGRIAFAASDQPPEPYVQVPDHRARDGLVGAIIGGLVTAGIVLATAGDSFEAGVGLIVFTPLGILLGAVIGSVAAKPDPGDMARGGELMGIVRTTDLAGHALRELMASATTHGRFDVAMLEDRVPRTRAADYDAFLRALPEQGHETLLEVRVVSAGLRRSGSRFRVFGAVRTSLIELPSGRVIYWSVIDDHGARRRFRDWTRDGSERFDEELKQSVRRAVDRSYRHAFTRG